MMLTLSRVIGWAKRGLSGYGGVACLLVSWLAAPDPARAQAIEENAPFAAWAEPLPEALDAPALAWVDATLEGMDLRERVAQLVMVWISGAYAARSSPELEKVSALVAERGIGGLVISLGTPYSYVAKLNHLQSLSEVPLLVAADFEAGAGYRVGGIYALPYLMEMGGATRFPPAMALGAIDDERVAYDVGRITAAEGRALGVHLNFGPVLDVNSNPLNPIINTRSLGGDPGRVAALGAAWIRGLRDGGMLTTAKHFPGHGDTEVDSHLSLPAIAGNRARLDSIELVPFRAAIREGVDAVMTAHIALPLLLGSRAPPATLAPDLMTSLLREELAFEGLLFTDALDMGAIVNEYGANDAAVRALEAGADVLLMPEDPEAAIDGVVEAVEEGRLTPERIERSVRRLLETKARLGLDRRRMVDAEKLSWQVGTPAHQAFADSVAGRSITLVRDRDVIVPLPLASDSRVLSVTYAQKRDLVAGRTFDARLEQNLSGTEPGSEHESGRRVLSIRLDGDATPDLYDSLFALADSVDAVIVSTYVAPRSGAGAIDISEELARALTRLDQTERPLVLASFGSPYVLAAAPETGTYALAWGGTDASQKAMADAVTGRAAVRGELPIGLPPLHYRGEGLYRPGPESEGRGAAPGAEARRPGAAGPTHGEVPAESVNMDPAALIRLDSLIEAAVRDSASPGVALAVGRHGRLVRLRGYGRVSWLDGASPVTDSTLYDLASLTKVLATTTRLMTLVADGRVELDAPVWRYLPEWGLGWKARVRVRDLLLHRAGLPPFRDFWRRLRGPSAYRTAIAALEAEYPPDSASIYSDIGFMTLGFLSEEVDGRPLDRWVEEAMVPALGLRETGFRPPEAWRSRVAPTEVDSTYRMRLVHGTVHDENAHAMGGVAGHAGLFGSARDLARWADALLAAARADTSRMVDGFPETSVVRRFTRRHADGSSRALGWDTPSGRSSAGELFTADAFGHTGFTGTSMWIDPELDLYVVLLTNRVHPTRENSRHVRLRRAVHDAAAAAITDRHVEPRSARAPATATP